MTKTRRHNIQQTRQSHEIGQAWSNHSTDSIIHIITLCAFKPNAKEKTWKNASKTLITSRRPLFERKHKGKKTGVLISTFQISCAGQSHKWDSQNFLRDGKKWAPAFLEGREGGAGRRGKRSYYWTKLMKTAFTEGKERRLWTPWGRRLNQGFAPNCSGIQSNFFFSVKFHITKSKKFISHDALMYSSFTSNTRSWIFGVFFKWYTSKVSPLPHPL